MVSVFPCFLHMIMLPKYLNANAIVLDRALVWAAIDYALSQGPLLFHGIRANLSGNPGSAIVNYLLDFKMICYIFPWNNSIYIIGRNCRLDRVLGVFNKWSGLRPSDILSICWLGWRRHARTVNNHLWNRMICHFKVSLLLFTLILLSARRPLTSLGMSAWPYRATTKYSYCIIHTQGAPRVINGITWRPSVMNNNVIEVTGYIRHSTMSDVWNPEINLFYVRNFF